MLISLPLKSRAKSSFTMGFRSVSHPLSLSQVLLKKKKNVLLPSSFQPSLLPSYSFATQTLCSYVHPHVSAKDPRHNPKSQIYQPVPAEIDAADKLLQYFLRDKVVRYADSDGTEREERCTVLHLISAWAQAGHKHDINSVRACLKRAR